MAIDFSYLEGAAPQKENPSTQTNTANVTIRVDADSMLVCDGDYIDQPFKAAVLTKIQLPIGQHLLEFLYAEDPEIKIEKEVDFPEAGKSYLVITKGLKDLVDAAAEEAKRKAEEEAKRKAEEEAKRKAEEEAKRKAEEEAKRKAEEEAKRKAEEEAKRKAEEEAKRKAEEEAKRKAAEEAKRKAAEEAKRKAEEEAKRKAEEEAKRKAEEEAKRKAEEEAKRKAEEEAKRKAEEEAKRKAEEEAKRKAEEEAKRKAEEEARRKAEEEAKRKAEEEAKRKAEEEAKRKAEEEAKRLEKLRTTINGHKFVDLGLPSGLRWATCNIGANSPEEYGDYYAWGEVETKPTFTKDNSVTYNKIMNSISGDSTYDVVRKIWGSSWRMPTRDELKELLDMCKWQKTTQGDVKGYQGIGPNGNSIFLPAAGWRTKYGLADEGKWCMYWSSDPIRKSDNHTEASSLKIGGFWGNRIWIRGREFGLSIRPVSE